MADINNDSTVKEEQEKEESTPMDTTEENMKKEEKEDKKDDDKKEDTKEEKDDAEENEDDDSEVEEDEELPPGLLEQPLEVHGKREKKKVERLSAAVVQSAEKKKVEIEDGSGVKLGDVEFIESQINKIKAVDLKPLHRLLFLRLGAATEVKRNIRQFCGFTQPKDSKEHERRMTMLNKMHMPELKSICQVLGLERGGAKKDIVDRIMEFLMEPSDKGNKVVKGEKKRRSKSSGGKKDKKKGTKRKRTPKQVKKKAKKDDDDDDDDEEEEVGSLDEDEDDDDDKKEMSEEEIEEESEDEAPKKKKAKTEPKKKASSKVNGKKEKPPPKKEPKKRSPKKKIELEDSLSDDSDSDDEPIAKMIKSPPSNDELKELVKKILDGADLESVTMKTVVKEVYSKYPTFDLSDRKDFIKNTVREVIS